MSAMDKLLAAVNKAKTGTSKDRDDEYFYYPARDASGNGSAVIRFLPGKDDDEIPFVKLYTHGFQGPSGKWLIDNCPSTIGRECVVCAANSELYATLSKDDARKAGMNRKTSYISRILVVEDKKNQENEGKVFLFKFGSKVFDKISDALQPSDVDIDDGAKPINVFSLEDGANFKLKIRKYEGQTNYDKSEFDKPSKIKETIEYTDENDIQKFISPEKFKSSEELERKLNFVRGNKVAKPKHEEDDEEFEQIKTAATPPSKSVKVQASGDDDDILELMKKLAED